MKQQLIDSLVNNDTIETEELNERAEKVYKPEDATNIIKEYEEIFRMKRKGIITVAYYQRKVFSQFSEKEKFMALVSRFKIHKNTIFFKIYVFRRFSKHLRLRSPFEELFQGHQKNMSTKFDWVWICKIHSFQKAFSKLSLQFIMSQKYLDRLYSKCCKIFKAFVLKLSLWRKSLSRKSSIDLQKN